MTLKFKLLILILLYASTSVNPRGAVLTTSKMDKPLFNWNNASVYHLMTDRFFNGNPNNDNAYGRKGIDAKGLKTGAFMGGDFKGITDKINEGYFEGLGTDVLWISAPYEQIHGFVSGGKNGEFAHYAYHGYYPLDYTMTDENFGTVEEFRELTEAAHGKGMRIILDVVINHAGYATLKDMEELNFGKSSVTSSWEPGESENYSDFNGYIDYKDEKAWEKWWGREWVRADLPGYDKGGTSDLTMNLSGLPDFKTEALQSVSLPPVLKTKWAGEKMRNSLYALPSYESLRQERNLSPSDYLILWLTEWVREFGIDGFRVDTAKHIDRIVPLKLKKEADRALKEWRSKNPSKPGAEFEDDFYMAAEIWGYTPGDKRYPTEGYNGVINFGFQGESKEGPAYDLKSMKRTMEKYSSYIIEEDPDLLSYISSHDTKLYPRSRLKDGITYLSLLPGTVILFYGDETGRKYQESSGDTSQSGRSFMNWEEADKDILSHAQKMFTFRKHNVAVGSGVHKTLSDEPFIFQRVYDTEGIYNKIIAVVGAKGDVSISTEGIADDGEEVTDWYTGRVYTVRNGSITIKAGKEGIILIGKAKR